MFTFFFLESKYVSLVTAELSKLESFENSVWFGTRSWNKRDSSDTSFDLKTVSVEGTREVRLVMCVCLVAGHSQMRQLKQSSHLFSWIFPLNPLKELKRFICLPAKKKKQKTPQLEAWRSVSRNRCLPIPFHAQRPWRTEEMAQDILEATERQNE